MDLGAFCQGPHPQVTTTTLRQGCRMTAAMLVMTGLVTMLGLSRWAGKGGSDRTVQRFFAQERDIHYGPSFQAIERLWYAPETEKEEALAQIRLPEGLTEEAYTLHPALLEACLQVLAAPLSHA
jgi:hypothetical protein